MIDFEGLGVYVLVTNNSHEPSRRKMGRQIATNAFLDSILSYTQVKYLTYSDFLSSNWTPPSDIDVLITYDPNLSLLSKRRQWFDPTLFSIVGITHTLSTPFPLQSISSIRSSDIYPWDALICTSNSAHSAVTKQFSFQDSLVLRRGGSPSHWPSLPVIPIGCHSSFFQDLPDKHHSRTLLNIKNDNNFVLLWTGRLEQHCKAHQSSTFRIVERLAKANPGISLTLIFYGTSVMPDIPSALLDLSQFLAPTVTSLFLDGHDINLGLLARSAADVFISLVDSYQETFGLTPIEAMASSLPVVVSDWNGYRDSVIHNKTGFLIPTSILKNSTISFPSIDMLKEQYLDKYSHDVSSSIIIDEDFAFNCLQQLVQSPVKRLGMSSLAHQHASMYYKWPFVMSRYADLFHKLRQSRLLASNTFPKSKYYSPLPSLTDIFSSWPTSCLSVSSYIVNTFFDVNHLRIYLGQPINLIYASLLPSSRSIFLVYSTALRFPSEFSFDQLELDVSSMDTKIFAKSFAFLLKNQYFLIHS